MIINSIIFFPWGMILDLSNDKTFTNLDNFQTYGDYFVKAITIIFLIIDFRKFKFPYLFLVCIATAINPFIGIIIFSILFLESRKESASA
jgi:hypothetical protein